MKAIFLGMLLFAATPLTLAEGDVGGFRPTETEMQQLPPYCAVRFNNDMNSPEWKAWRSTFGGNFLDIHHYCAGLNFLNRYYRVKPSEKSGQLQGAKRNFEYMQRAAGAGFLLRGEIYMNHGITMKLMGQPGQAIKDLQQAIDINPMLAKAYLELATLYRDIKQPGQAMETTVKGLKRVPDYKALQRQYLQLGGKEPFPEPIKVDPPVAAAPEPSPVVSPEPNPATEPKPAAAPNPVEDSAAKAAIGTPGNPYCRFCPPPDASP